MRKGVLTASLLSLVFLSACANQQAMDKSQETKVRESKGAVEIVSVPVDFESVVVAGEKACAMPSASTTLGDTGASVGLAAAGESVKLDGGSVSAGTLNQGSATYFADEVLYRLCELGINYELTKSEMLDYYLQTLKILTSPPQ